MLFRSRHQPDPQGDEGGQGLAHPQALACDKDGNDDEDGPEQDRLAEVDRHGTPPHRGGQPTQPRQPAVRRRPTGIQGQQRQPAAGTGDPEDLLDGEVPRPQRDEQHVGQSAMECREGSQGQAADSCRDEQATVPIRLGDDVGVGQARADHRGGDDQRDDELYEQSDGPPHDIGDEPGQSHRRLVPLTIRPSHALRRGEAHRQEDAGGYQHDDGADDIQTGIPLAGQPPGKDDGDQTVNADDVAYR